MIGEFYKRVPKDRAENLRYRIAVRQRAAKDLKFRKACLAACREDYLYFLNVFSWLYEPRKKKEATGRVQAMVFPFITWPHQDDAILQICEHLGYSDIGCIAEGTPIVTDRGLVPIEQVTSCDLIYDGVDFVRSEGAVFQGVKDVIDTYCIEMTPDHQVLTEVGWADAALRLPREEVRDPGVCSQKWREVDLEVRLRGNSGCNIGGCPEGGAGWRNAELPQGLSSYGESTADARMERDSNLPRVGSDEETMPESLGCGLSVLRWARDQCLRAMGGIREFLGRHGGGLRLGNDHREGKQRPGVQSRELCLGQSRGSGSEPKDQSVCGCERGKGSCSRSSKASWYQRVFHEGEAGEGEQSGSSAEESYGLRDCPRSDDYCADGEARRSSAENYANENPQLRMAPGAVAGASKQARTYDILNCGPRRRFVAVGRDGRMVILHNCEKSRGEGMSWIGITLALHNWLFIPNSKIGLVSRTEEEADDPHDSDSLFWKIDWSLAKLPNWMAGKQGSDWKRLLDRHNLVNYRNNARISADAATGDVFRGGRLSWALMDEFAFFKKGEDAEALNASSGATNSRLFVSTVNGQGNEYHRIMHEPSNMVKVIIDWKQNISRNRGLYRLEEGKPVALDPVNNPLPENYRLFTEDVQDLFSRLRTRGFKLEDCERSPWYDHECDRPGYTPQRIAQELDRDYAGSEHRIFGVEFFAKCEKTVTPPLSEGNLEIVRDTKSGDLELSVQFQSVFDGPCKLWIPLDSKGNPPVGDYVFGADVSTGVGGSYTSNSTLIGIDAVTREQVFEIATNIIEPGEFAELAIGVCNWFHGAYLGWEHNGPGVSFTKRVVSVGYGNIYHRKSQSQYGAKDSKEIGWWTDEKTKRIMFSEIVRTVRSNEFIMRSLATKLECGQYVYLNGKIEHSAQIKTTDESSVGQAHGDRVIGLGVAIQCLSDRPLLRIEDVKRHARRVGEIPDDCPAARLKAIEDANKPRDRNGWKESVLTRRGRR